MNRFLGGITALVTIFTVGITAAEVQGAEQKYPNVVEVKVQAHGTNHFNFDVTISSPYDSEQRYADAFRILSVDGQVYGERRLLHDHATEQPFTRDLYGVTIPAEIRMVVVQAHDQKYGYGGKTQSVVLPGR